MHYAALCAFLLVADDRSVRPEANVAEAEGAKYVGLVMLLVMSVPFGVMILLDLSKLITRMQQRNEPRNKPRLPRQIGGNRTAPL